VISLSSVGFYLLLLLLISHDTASEQPVEWAHSSKMGKRIFEIFIKVAKFNEF